jgi:hypothetical protein
MSAPRTSGRAAPSLPGYRYLEHLGSGGNAQVYLYEQDMPRRKVAVKVLNEPGLTEAARRQFTAEANAMAGLADHPHIVQVFDAAVTPDGRPYLVMQYYSRPNLSARARRERFSVASVLSIGIQIGSAVETSHRNGILHRDVKPANILTGQFGTPALTDFGIATRKGAGGPEGMSVPWSPPEVLYGTSGGDERADVYSLGATLWHLLAGHSPFEEPGGDNSTLALMRRIQSAAPPRLPRGDVPDSLERLLRQAMAKDPAARPTSALELVLALRAVEQEQRLPLTQIVLAADDAPPPGGSVPAGPADRGPAPGGPVPAGPVPGGPAPGRPAPGRPAPGEGEATLVRGARRIVPQPAPPLAPPPAAARPPGQGAGRPARHEAAGDTTLVRGAGRADPWTEAPVAPPPRRHRQLPAETPEVATGIRPVLAQPVPAQPAASAPDTGTAAAPVRTRSPRLAGIAIGGILVIAAAGAAIAYSGHVGTDAPAPVPTASSTSPSALGPGIDTPSAPDVTVTRDGAGELSFRWTYVNHAPGDVFRWHRLSGGTGPPYGTTAKPALLVAAPRGQTVCITVQVLRTDGEGSSPSNIRCGS